jgi:predicted methyltransferase
MSIAQASNLLRACRVNRLANIRSELDQCPATATTTLRRLKLLSSRQDLNGRLLLLGDDDLLSVAIAATNPSTRVTVLDLDSDLLNRIEESSPHSRMEVLRHDLRQGLPSELVGCFDVAFTDPPYTLAGQLLFLKRAVAALRPNRGSSLYLCGSRVYLDDDDLATIIGAAESGGLGLKGVYEDFNKYVAPPDVQDDLRRANPDQDSKFFHSTLFHFVAVDGLTFPESIPTLTSNIYEYKSR